MRVWKLLKRPTKEEFVTISKVSAIGLCVVGILGFAIIKYKTAELEWISWIISVIAGILIILLSILVLEEEDENNP
mgnify:CR=1 FL=1